MSQSLIRLSVSPGRNVSAMIVLLVSEPGGFCDILAAHCFLLSALPLDKATRVVVVRAARKLSAPSHIFLVSSLTLIPGDATALGNLLRAKALAAGLPRGATPLCGHVVTCCACLAPGRVLLIFPQELVTSGRKPKNVFSPVR